MPVKEGQIELKAYLEGIEKNNSYLDKKIWYDNFSKETLKEKTYKLLPDFLKRELENHKTEVLRELRNTGKISKEELYFAFEETPETKRVKEWVKKEVTEILHFEIFGFLGEGEEKEDLEAWTRRFYSFHEGITNYFIFNLKDGEFRLMTGTHGSSAGRANDQIGKQLIFGLGKAFESGEIGFRKYELRIQDLLN